MTLHFDIVTQCICIDLNAVVTRDVAFYSDQLTGDGVTEDFPTTHQFKANSVLVFINGVLAKKGVTYAEGADQQTIEFAAAPAGGGSPDEILVHYAIL